MEKVKDEGIFFRNNQKSSIHCMKMQFTKPGICAPPHFHRYIEILYGIDCDIKVRIDDSVESFKTGDCCLVYSNETHYLYSENENSTYYVIKFLPEMLSYDGQTFSEMKCLAPVLCKNEGISHIITRAELEEYDMETVFKNILEEWEAENVGYEFAIRGHILRVFSLMLRLWGKSQSHQLLSAVNDENAMAIYKAIAYIDENYNTVTEPELAKIIHMSLSHFSRTFKKVTGKNFSQFVIDTRIDHAKKLLLTALCSITDIAFETGFSSSSHFISCFKQRTGMTPNDYRKKIFIQKEFL